MSSTIPFTREEPTEYEIGQNGQPTGNSRRCQTYPGTGNPWVASESWTFTPPLPSPYKYQKYNAETDSWEPYQPADDPVVTIAKLKKQLEDTDYIIIRQTEQNTLSAEEYQAILDERQACRDRINELGG